MRAAAGLQVDVGELDRADRAGAALMIANAMGIASRELERAGSSELARGDDGTLSAARIGSGQAPSIDGETDLFDAGSLERLDDDVRKRLAIADPQRLRDRR